MSAVRQISEATRSRNKARSKAARAANPGKAAADSKKWREQNPDYQWPGEAADRLRRRYGLTPEQWEDIKQAQGYRCALCGKRKKLVVDHDHDTGKVRAALCHGCNVGLGRFGDNPVRLRAAADYLETHGGSDERPDRNLAPSE